MHADTLDPEGIVLRWPGDGALPGLVIDGVVHPFALETWNQTVPTLQPGGGAAYRELARRGKFGGWWTVVCGGMRPGVHRFRLQLPPAQWRRPWEGLIGGLGPLAWERVSIIRQLDGDVEPVQPADLDRALVVLRPEGAEAAEGFSTLNLAAERHALEAAHAALDRSVREAVAVPITVPARLPILEEALIAHRPTVLWFSGHAIDDPPGLLLADGTWMKPADLASLLDRARTQSGCTPTYVVLWACQTGSAPPFGTPTLAPAFVRALTEAGIAAVLVAQAPLDDTVARYMAGRIFTALASGQPLDHGVAHARAELMRHAEELDLTWDWMCPVVWSRGYPPPAVRWKDQRDTTARHQSIARRLLPATLARVPLEGAPTSAWPDVPRLWVVSEAPAAEGPRVAWATRVLAHQHSTLMTVLWLDFASSLRTALTPDAVLRDWAKGVLRSVTHDDDPNRFLRTAAQQIQSDHAAGWRALCSSREYLLALIEPPDRDAPWLWEGLRDGAARAVVLSHRPIENRAAEGWRLETMLEPTERPPFSPEVGALAVLAYPAARRDLEDAGVALATIDKLVQTGVVIETAVGCVMRASAAEEVAKQIPAGLHAECHRLAYRFLDGKVALRKLADRDREDILRARWRHAELAEWREAMRVEATNLVRLFARQDRPAAVLTLIASLLDADHDPEPDVPVILAWAYLAEGRPDDAISWLEANSEESARWLLARAEAEKSSGQATNAEKASGKARSKQQAREYLKRALRILEGDDSEDAVRMRLRCLHDLARLTHFFDRRPEDAVNAYQEVERGWEVIPHSDLDRAITVRNLAEALMEAGHADSADAHVVRARELIPPYSEHPLVSELEYLAGRIAIRRGLPEEEIRTRFEACRWKALTTNYMMMAAIVEARVFWRDPNQQDPEFFDEALCKERADRLVVFGGHLWAARVLRNGRLRAAKRLLARGERRSACAELSEARRLVDANPALDADSDRLRIAQLIAGFWIVAGGSGDWREGWRDRHTWIDGYGDSANGVWDTVE